MNYISIVFLFFFISFLLLYYVSPKEKRYLVILIGSYVFYGFKDPSLDLFLLASTVITYFGGMVLYKKKNKFILSFFVASNILMLVFFKYFAFFKKAFNIVAGITHLGLDVDNSLDLVMPVGMSFYIFQSTTYLTDIYNDRIEAEKNFLLYAAFVSFFPTILSGPIQKSRELIPQIRCPQSFDSDEAKKGFILFVWGCFQKLLVANSLAKIIYKVYAAPTEYSAAFLLVAMACYSLYIYADFNSYSDMARGIAKLLGINVGKNFDNPYLSLSVSEFWNRWHRSLNSFLLENIYIPLGGNRKGKLRKYINILLVFFVSGLWHGSLLHFVVWGVINGLLVVVDGMTRSLRDKCYGKMHIDQNLESIVFMKRAIVFGLISFTWLFFDRGISDSKTILEIISSMHFVNLFDDRLLCISGSYTETILVFFSLLIFICVQIKRTKEEYYYQRFNAQPVAFQGMLMAVLIISCIITACAAEASINTEFIYFNF